MPETPVRLISSLCDIKFLRVAQPDSVIADDRGVR
ncbi:Uncharacterised protein [Yersinia pekkanenii]|uniref:Uncharacterized protein n=1 Tax=Yersinia pekkanenii TaxID=1288385 RepID=A0A0T9P266_9GAMM|nr:Uncharacterised protein [Yersinia pekkanenii]CRY66818.1 Uncharacterised protein [Yersinia pekkanenii]